MAKGKRAKQRRQQQRQQQGMEVEGAAAGGGGGGGGDWQTSGPVAGGDGSDDFIEMDTADAGAGAAGVQKAGGPKPAVKRGARTTKQKARKRKSLEKALAVASRTETKTKQRESVSVKKKGLKKLWTNEKPLE